MSNDHNQSRKFSSLFSSKPFWVKIKTDHFFTGKYIDNSVFLSLCLVSLNAQVKVLIYISFIDKILPIYAPIENTRMCVCGENSNKWFSRRILSPYHRSCATQIHSVVTAISQMRSISVGCKGYLTNEVNITRL